MYCPDLPALNDLSDRFYGGSIHIIMAGKDHPSNRLCVIQKRSCLCNCTRQRLFAENMQSACERRMSDGSVITRRRTNINEVQVGSLGLQKGAMVGVDTCLRQCL